MNPEQVFEYVMELSLLPYFPAEDAARMAIARMIGGMCETEDQARWLVTVMTSGVFEKWEGPAELRATFCQKFRPKDGIEAVSRVYRDGMSREQLNPGKRITAPAPLQIEGLTNETTALVEAVVSNAKRLPGVDSVQLKDGENDYEGLLRIVCESKEPLPSIKVGVLEKALEEETARIKSEQDKNRKGIL